MATARTPPPRPSSSRAYASAAADVALFWYTMATLAPREASSLEMPAPMLRVPPVTMATLPMRSVVGAAAAAAAAAAMAWDLERVAGGEGDV